MIKFYSTNNANHLVGLEEAVFKGLAPDKGLYMPTEIKHLSPSVLAQANTMSLQEIAFKISHHFLSNYLSDADLKDIVDEAINFSVPLKEIEKNIYSLELFYGPTCAFKDFGGRFMSRLMQKLINKRATQQKQLYILVATSGDTGSAVASGFYGVEGINVIILYPSKKVSHIQEQQLTTLEKNIQTLEIKGTFDDCQNLVKQAFLDQALNQKLNLTSANSINIARLIPQSFYYAFASATLTKSLTEKQDIIFSVPSGNFGNLTAGLLAQKIGFNIKSFIAATNANDVVPEYLRTGNFNAKTSITTISNAMDVGNPSNFTRLQNLFNKDINLMRADINGYAFSDEQTKDTIKQVFKNTNYILDPHGAVAYLGVKAHQQNNPNAENTKYILLETAHPAKFADVVEPILNQKIDIPTQLQACLTKQKQSKIMSTTFADFKSFLMGLKLK